jgi:hypothetical protein
MRRKRRPNRLREAIMHRVIEAGGRAGMSQAEAYARSRDAGLGRHRHADLTETLNRLLASGAIVRLSPYTLVAASALLGPTSASAPAPRRTEFLVEGAVNA